MDRARSFDVPRKMVQEEKIGKGFKRNGKDLFGGNKKGFAKGKFGKGKAGFGKDLVKFGGAKNNGKGNGKFKDGGEKRFKKGKNRDLTITFNEDARKDFLTGFRARKLARKVEGRKIAEEQRKEELREERKKKRAVLKERMSELEEIEEYFNLVSNSGVNDESGDQNKTVTEMIHRPQHANDDEFQVEVTTCLGLPDRFK